MSFWMKLVKFLGTEVVTTAKVKGKYMTAVKVVMFGITLRDEYRKSTEAEKKVARKAAK